MPKRVERFSQRIMLCLFDWRLIRISGRFDLKSSAFGPRHPARALVKGMRAAASRGGARQWLLLERGQGWNFAIDFLYRLIEAVLGLHLSGKHRADVLLEYFLHGGVFGEILQLEGDRLG